MTLTKDTGLNTRAKLLIKSKYFLCDFFKAAFFLRGSLIYAYKIFSQGTLFFKLIILKNRSEII